MWCSPTSTTRSPRTAGSPPTPTPRWSGCARPGFRSCRSPAGRPAGATTSRACGRSTAWWARTAPSTSATTRRGASSSRRFVGRATRARQPTRSGSTRSRERILRRVPGTALASDQLYREADLAIDFCEDVPPLPRAEVDRIVALFEAAGCTAKISSIHVNGWFGSYDKLAHDAHAACASASASTSTPTRDASCSPATRPTTRRCSPSFPTPSAWPTCAASSTASPRRRDTSPSAKAARLRRARRSAARRQGPAVRE